MIASGDLRLALNIAVAVLIITCPCALGLAVPAVTTAASGRLFRRGLLIKSATALERLAEVDCVVFDKTGTLTEGRPRLASPLDDTEAARVALALAQASAHPLAQALAEAARAAGIVPARVTGLTEVPGHGVEGRWRGMPVRRGRAEWIGAAPPAQTATCLALPDRHLTYTFTDRLRPGAAEAVAGLQAMGLRVELLSGDTAPAVAALAKAAGIEAWQAGVLPAGKAARLAALAAEGHRVLMVGDGLNDTAALAAAHASISPASALEAARVVSDIVLLGTTLARRREVPSNVSPPKA
jgi:Cu2+-exporting ATPase